MQRRPNTTRLREDNGDGLTTTKIKINESKLMSKRRRDAARHPAVRIFICLIIAVYFALEFKVWPLNLVTISTSSSSTTHESASNARIGVPVSNNSAAQSGRIPQPQKSTTGRAQGDNATAGYEETTFNFAKDDPERAPILRILLEQGGYNLNDKSIFNDETLALLPKWSEVQQLYGPPKILGVEKCTEFQQTISVKDQNIGVAGNSLAGNIGVAGMFNSGTNLLSELIATNCIDTGRMDTESPDDMKWQGQPVPWGKHMPASLRDSHTRSEMQDSHHLYNATLVVITVRDPYTWMQSMCRQGYATQFEHSITHCPNIIPYKEDIEAHRRFAKMKYIPVIVKYNSDLKFKYESLVHYWNVWYSEYKKAEFPRLFVRMEDLLFHGEEVVTQICECGGGTMRTPFMHVQEVANRNLGIEQNHKLAGLIGSLIRYGNIKTRKQGYPPFQLQAARNLLDSTLMKLFGYPYEKVPHNSSSTIVEGTVDKFL
jgi:hypothetical protein